MHPNTKLLIDIQDKAIELGWYKKYPKKCFCQEVARRCGELGNENPSDRAIKIALNMLYFLKKRNKRINPSRRTPKKIPQTKMIYYICPRCKYKSASVVFPNEFNSTLIYCSYCDSHSSVSKLLPTYNPSKREWKDGC